MKFISNPANIRKWEKFKKNKRAYYSLLVLFYTYLISLFSPLLINNKPLFVLYEGSVSFPIFQFYPETKFGGNNLTEPNYKKLNRDPRFQDSSNRMVFPPIPFGVNEDNLDSLEEGTNPPSKPTFRHWMGTDDRGRDVFTRIVYGYRLAMTFSLILIVVEILLASFIGGVQGYFVGRLDLFLQRLIEILSAIPFLYLILIMGSFFGRGFMVLIVTYGSLSWIGLSYYMRGEFLKLRKQQFVDAAKTLGASSYSIIMRHLLPNSLTPLVTFLPFILISAISVLSALDFLGYGIPAPNPSWGELIGQGRERLTAWWLITFPSVALFLTILFSAFVGEGLRDAFDPKDKVVYE
ncbi:ABC transporter permease [Leptospira levettii]|uniref:ABC transporter permease n=1 Tax=Leptospira levettii TaxID=2023178 RepID=UPI0010839E44|nr:ABC transporter permease subunit [Leptospira levettii]TGK98898.1 ABC transporter permease subunit [Leptospira levettii]